MIKVKNTIKKAIPNDIKSPWIVRCPQGHLVGVRPNKNEAEQLLTAKCPECN